MKIIEKYKRKTEGLSNSEIAKEAALLIKSRLIHRYRLAKALFTSTEITDEKLWRSLKLERNRDLLDYYRNRTRPLIYSGMRDAARVGEIYADNFPSSMEATVKDANA